MAALLILVVLYVQAEVGRVLVDSSFFGGL